MTGTHSGSDDELIAAANRGDPHAFEALYGRYRDWVVGLAYRLSGDREDALDVLQETFAYFFRKFPGFRLTARLKTFLYPVVRHLALGCLRRRRPHASLEAIKIDPPAAPAEGPGAGDALAALLKALDDDERELLLLRFVDDLSLREIAAVLGIPLGTVKSRLHNLLEALRRDPRAKKYFEP